MTAVPITPSDRAELGALRAVLHAGPPLVHCLTNIVVAGFTANVLLAVGASPAMVENAAESADFARIAGAVLINLGTLSQERDVAVVAAAGAAHGAGVPWVLDPVAVGALAHRTRLAVELLQHRPSVIRGNGSEILGLAGAGPGGRGVDSLATSSDAVGAARVLAADHGCVVAVSGEVDYVTDGDRVVPVPGGTPLLTKVTGVGCALGALVAAALGAGLDAMTAAVAASQLVAAAGEAAAVRAPLPGSFAVALLDELASAAA